MRAIVSSIFLATLVAADPASAEGTANELSVSSGTRALRTPSANAVTADSLLGGAFDYARDLHITLLPNLAIWAEGGIAWGSATGSMFQTMTTDVGTFATTIGARARYSLHRLVAVSGRLDLGIERASLKLMERSLQASDAGWGALGAAAIAADVFVLARRHFGIGMRAELGYTRVSKIALAPSFEQPSEGTLQLPMVDASIGHLDLSGPSFAFSLVGQF